MESKITDGPSFAHINFYLEPGESLTTESDAMASMSAEMDMKASFNGGLISGLLKKFLGNESLFVSHFTNNTNKILHLCVTQATPGDMRKVSLDNDSICLQPGAYICSTPGVKLGLRWAGFASLIAREGLFKLVMSGKGDVWYGAYGCLLDKEVNGEYIIDTSHLVSYEPQMKLKIQLSGGIFSSFFSSEGFVNRIEGKGKIVIQSRSIDGLRGWMNPRI